MGSCLHLLADGESYAPLFVHAREQAVRSRLYGM